MRFVILVAGVATTSALSVGAIQTMFPQTAQTFQAARALGGDLTNFKISDLNPFKAYEDVTRQIRSGGIGTAFNLGASGPKISTPVAQNWTMPTVKVDQSFQRAFGSSINAQIQQNYNRSQDMAAYARNPMAWHGAPPH